jgi:hypothetical protein
MIKAKLAEYNVQVPPSISKDVAGYRMYYCPEDQELTEDASFIDLGLVESFDFPGTHEGLKNLNGNYRVAGRSYDKFGNLGESGAEIIVPLDSMPPAPPGAFVFTLKDSLPG